MAATGRTATFYVFYWIGVVMAFACVALILAGNTEPVYRFEHAHFPLLWPFAGIAVLVFLVLSVAFQPTPSRAGRKRATSQRVPVGAPSVELPEGIMHALRYEV